ncbi:carbohydrate ABC transporter permease [Spirillospora sp. CA-294931]|uniref:carbohydrate ABC transporter permease n=1 Tax=Spirillospora sp. CA-294931 TaxID=3240042 RepID=UPI003D8FDABA
MVPEAPPVAAAAPVAKRQATAVRRRRRPRPNGAALFLLSPFLLLFAGTYAAPMAYSVFKSLFREKRSGLGLSAPVTEFAGVDQYVKVFSDEAVMRSLGRVLLFGIVQVPIMLGLALVLALLLDSAAARFTKFFRLAFFLPYAVPGVVGAILWAFLYQPGFSPLDDILHVDLLGEGTVLWSAANIVTWTWTGYNMLVIYTALQALPRSLYEAAALDGASAWTIAWRIKVPLVRPALVLTGVFSIIGTLQLFNEPSVLRPISGNVSSTYTPAMAAYNAAFGANDFNYAAAIAVVLAATACVLSYVFFTASSRGADK